MCREIELMLMNLGRLITQEKPNDETSYWLQIHQRKRELGMDFGAAAGERERERK